MIAVLKRPRALLTLMLLSVLLAGLAQWALSARRVDAAPAAAPPPKAAPALVAVAGQLPPGYLIQPGDLTELAWPAETRPTGAIPAGSAEARALVGSVTRRAFSDGELVLPSAVLRPGDRGFLASVILPGHRAIAIAVEAATAAGGLIWPGDRVDVILTQELRDDSVPLGQRVLSETILTDARILSTDQTLAPASQAPAATETTPARPVIPATVTLEVTPAEAERVTVGGTLGKLHLTLRAVAAETGTPPPPATWASSVSPGLASVRVQPPAARSAAPLAPAPPSPVRANAEAVRIYRGSAEGVK
jgi:pilus assembly protein CpaB